MLKAWESTVEVCLRHGVTGVETTTESARPLRAAVAPRSGRQIEDAGAQGGTRLRAERKATTGRGCCGGCRAPEGQSLGSKLVVVPDGQRVGPSFKKRRCSNRLNWNRNEDSRRSQQVRWTLMVEENQGGGAPR